MLNKKITEILLATSSALAWITGAVAAMAEAPQIDEPTQTKVGALMSRVNHLCKRNAMINDTKMVLMIIGKDSVPTFTTWVKLRPNPKSTTAICKTYFEVKAIPSTVCSRLV